MKTVFATAIAVGALMLGLSGCAPTTSTSTEVTEATESASAESTQTADSSPEPEAGEPEAGADGRCTAESELARAVNYTVYADSATTPVEVSYTVFFPDRPDEIVSETVTGPAHTITVFTCANDVPDSAPWTFTASAQIPGGSLGCVLAFGGKLVDTKSEFVESSEVTSVSADCSGHPGM